MSTTFVTSDCHFAHYNIVLHCNRKPWIYPNPNFDPSKPTNFKFNNPMAVHLQSHDSDLIKNWNSVVGRHDHVYILGDFAWNNHSTYLGMLNGHKFLIRGNHDKMHNDSLRLFSKLGGAHFQYSYYTKIYGRRIMLSHCPYETWFSSHHGSWHFHGHCHGNLPEKVNSLRIDVGVDVWNYQPIPWDVIEAKMAEKEKLKKEFEKVDQEIDEEDSVMSNENADKLRIENLKFLSRPRENNEKEESRL